MKIKKLLLTFIAAMSLGVSHADEGTGNTVNIDISNQTSQWISLVSDKNLYFNSSYSSTQASPGEACYAFKAVAGDLEKGVVYLKHISVVPANTPIWIWGSKKIHSISILTAEVMQSLDLVFDNV